MDFESIIERIKGLKNLRADKKVAAVLGFSKGAFSERKRRGSIPKKELELFCERESINMDWLLTGEGEMHRQPHIYNEGPVDIKDIPLCNMKQWLDDFWQTAGEDEKAWLKVHFRKCFPDFEQWLLKKESGAEDAPPETRLKAG